MKHTTAAIILLAVFILVFLFMPFRPLRFLALLALLVEAVALLHSAIAPRLITIRRDEETIRVNRFQKFPLKLTIRNLSILPMHSLTVSDRLGGLHSNELGNFLLSLGPRQTHTISYEAEGHERGEFLLGPVEISGRDPFGFFSWRKSFPAPLRVIVYPAVYPLSLEQMRGLPSGNLKAPNRLYEDITRYRSLREYVPGDEMKRINWKVSAKLGKLYSMEYVPSMYFPVLILLNLTDYDYPLNHKQQVVERAIEVAASLVFFFVGLKQEVGLLTTGRIAGAEGFPVAPMRAGYGHAVNILEILARIAGSDQRVDFTRQLSGSGVRVHTGTKIMAVTPPLREEQKTALFGIRRKGYDIEVFVISTYSTRGEDTVVQGLTSYSVSEYGAELVHG